MHEKFYTPRSAGQNIKYLPPPEPTPGEKIYPPPSNQDHVLKELLGLGSTQLPSFYVNTPAYAEVVQKYAEAKVELRKRADLLCSMVTGASANGPLSADPETRSFQIYYYVNQHPELFPVNSQDNFNAQQLASKIGEYSPFTISFALAYELGINHIPLFPPPGYVRFPSGCINIRVAPAVINP